MGCWSESCVLSGLEISSGTPVYGLKMRRNDSGGWVVYTPLLEGTYDDYGGIDLTRSESYLGYESGNNVELGASSFSHSVFVRQDVYDIGKGLPVEFPYVRNPETGKGELREGLTVFQRMEAWRERTVRGLDEIRKEVELRGSSDVRPMSMVERFIYDNFNRGELLPHVGWISEYLRESLHGYNFDVMEGIDGYCRLATLFSMGTELRKLIRPGIVGPQHGGEQALLSFYEKVLPLVRDQSRDEF